MLVCFLSNILILLATSWKQLATICTSNRPTRSVNIKSVYIWQTKYLPAAPPMALPRVEFMTSTFPCILRYSSVPLMNRNTLLQFRCSAFVFLCSLFCCLSVILNRIRWITLMQQINENKFFIYTKYKFFLPSCCSKKSCSVALINED